MGVARVKCSLCVATRSSHFRELLQSCLSKYTELCALLNFTIQVYMYAYASPLLDPSPPSAYARPARIHIYYTYIYTRLDCTCIYIIYIYMCVYMYIYIYSGSEGILQVIIDCRALRQLSFIKMGSDVALKSHSGEPIPGNSEPFRKT